MALSWKSKSLHHGLIQTVRALNNNFFRILDCVCLLPLFRQGNFALSFILLAVLSSHGFSRLE